MALSMLVNLEHLVVSTAETECKAEDRASEGSLFVSLPTSLSRLTFCLLKHQLWGPLSTRQINRIQSRIYPRPPISNVRWDV